MKSRIHVDKTASIRTIPIGSINEIRFSIYRLPKKRKAIDAVFSECERCDPNLTVTVDFLTNKNYIYANFDPVNI